MPNTQDSVSEQELWRDRDDLGAVSGTAEDNNRPCVGKGRGAARLDGPRLTPDHCLAKNTSGSCRPFGHMKFVTVSRLSPHAKYWFVPLDALPM